MPALSMQKEFDWSGARRGALDPLPPRQSWITIRIDDEIIDWFRKQVHAAGGGKYQTLINTALREHIERHSLEELLRRVVREELSRASQGFHRSSS